MSIQLIPLGIRCNAAIVTTAIINQPRLPFDWTQMNVGSMIQVMFLKENLREYWTTYFSNLDSNNYHRVTKSWFPHDEYTSAEEKANTIEKYIRRTNRLIHVLDSPIPKVFLIFFGYPEYDSLEKATQLIMCLRSRISAHHKILVFNAQYIEKQIDNIYFFYEKLPEDVKDEKEDAWSMLTKNVEKRVRNILSEWNVEPISFEST